MNSANPPSPSDRSEPVFESVLGESPVSETPAMESPVREAPDLEVSPPPRFDGGVPVAEVLKLQLSQSMRSTIEDGLDLAQSARLRGLFGTGMLLIALLNKGESTSDPFYAPRFLHDQLNRRGQEALEQALGAFVAENRLPDSAATTRPDHVSRHLWQVLQAAARLPSHDQFIAARHVIVALLAEPPPAGATASAWRILEKAGIDRADVLREFVTSLAKQGPDQEREAWDTLRRGFEGDTKPATKSAREAAARLLVAGYHPDTPTGRAAEDCLDLEATIGAMAQLIASPQLDGTLSLGVFGNWGSGKSFFMALMRERIEQIARDQRQRDDGRRPPDFWPNIAQVEFNAWHYVDSNLWASLMSHLLDTLRRWSPDGEPARGRSRLAEAIERLEITSRARDDAVAQKRQAEIAQTEAQQLRRETETALGDAHERLRAALAQSVWAIVEHTAAEPVQRARETLGSLALAHADATRSVESLYTQIKELTTTAGRVHAIAQRLLRDRAGARAIAWIGGAAIAAVGLVLAGSIWWDWFRHASTMIGSALVAVTAAATRFVTWIQSTAAQTCELLEPLAEVRTIVERKLDEAKQKKAADVAKAETEVEAHRIKLEALTAEVAAREAEVRRAEQAVQDVASGRAVRDFIAQRLEAGDYQKHLGLIATIRRDFEQLSHLVRAHNSLRLELPGDIEDIERKLRLARPDISAQELTTMFTNIGINRIVLYIDDLDRCPSSRVVEVLQAIHLLLSFPIFVVVVGVDSRWMSHSLAREYPSLLTRAANPGGQTHGWSREEAMSVVTPADYLEKIFQIPFWVPPLTTAAARLMIERLAASPTLDVQQLGRPPEPPPSDRVPATGEPAARPAPPTATVSDQSTAGGASPADTAPPGASPRDPAPPPAPAVLPDLLRITAEEREAMQSLATIIGRSPRATKRFVNSYRLLKVALLEGPDGEQRSSLERIRALEAPMFLLGIVTGLPTLASEFVAMLPENPGAGVLSQVGALADWADGNIFHADAVKRMREFAIRPEAGRWAGLRGGDLLPWVTRVAQFSFEDLIPSEPRTAPPAPG